MPDLFLVACIVVVAGALAYLAVDAIRWANRRHARQATTEPVSPAGTTTRPGRLLLRLVRRTHSEPEPVHVGATEADGAFFRAVREDLQTHPGFTQELPVVRDETDYVAEFEAHMDRLKDDFADRVYRAEEHAGRECERALMTYGAGDTGVYDLAELEAKLEGVGA